MPASGKNSVLGRQWASVYLVAHSNTAHGESATMGFKSCRPHEETQTAYLHRACSVTIHVSVAITLKIWCLHSRESWCRNDKSTVRFLKGQNNNIPVQRAIFTGGNSNRVIRIFCIYVAFFHHVWLLHVCSHADIHTVAATCSSGLTNHSDTIDGLLRLFWGPAPCSRTLRLQEPRTDDLCINGVSILALGLLSSLKQSLLFYSRVTVLNVERPFHNLPISKHCCRSNIKKGSHGGTMSWKHSHMQKVADLNMSSNHKQWFQNDFLKYDQSFL